MMMFSVYVPCATRKHPPWRATRAGVDSPRHQNMGGIPACLHNSLMGIYLPNCRYAAIISWRASTKLSRHSVNVLPSVITSGHSNS